MFTLRQMIRQAVTAKQVTRIQVKPAKIQLIQRGETTSSSNSSETDSTTVDSSTAESEEKVQTMLRILSMISAQD